MGFLDDLRYFGPGLGLGKGSALLLAKARKAVRKRRLAEDLRRGESDDTLLRRLDLPPGTEARGAGFRAHLEPLRPLFAPDELSESEVRTRAKEILEGRQNLFGRTVAVGWPPEWSWRWDGGPEERTFARDVRSTWELQRLQGILPLAWGAQANGEEEGERFARA